MKRKFIIDFDSTIADSHMAYCNAYNQMYKDHKEFKEADCSLVERWDLLCQCPLEKSVENIFGNKLFFDNLNLFPRAYEELLKLNEEYELIICSLGGYNNISHKSQWIGKNLPFIKNAILLSNNGCKTDKSIVNMEDSFFMDDHMSNLNSSNAKIKLCFGKKFDWNSKWDGHWITSWENAFDKIRKIEINQLA
jgi:5'(3')-deoxyribonucleotidase